MKTTLTLWLLFAATLFARAQESSGTKSSRWTFGINVTPELSYRTTIARKSFAEASKQTRDKTEDPKNACMAGLFTEYKLADRWRLGSGLFFSNKGEQTQWKGGAYTFGANRVYFRYSFKYLSIPLAANYYITRGKWALFTGASVSMNIFLDASVQVVKDKGSKPYSTTRQSYPAEAYGSLPIGPIRPPSPYNPFCWAWSVSAGIDRQIGKRYLCRVQPVYTRFITPLVEKDSPLNEKFLSAGIGVSILYKL